MCIKHTILRVLVLSGLILNSQAQQESGTSLYSLAPLLGSDDISIPLTWSASLSMGYDSNLNSYSSGSSSKENSVYLRPGVTATYADFKNARTTQSFYMNLGAIYYFKKPLSGKEWNSDSHISYQLTHHLNSRLTVHSANSIAYQLEPDYAMGLSSSRISGSYRTYSTMDSIAYKWSSRFSSTTRASASAIEYDDLKTENRVQLSVGETFSYVLNTITIWNLNYNYQDTQRKYGLDSTSHFITTGLNYKLSALSALNFNVGAQLKSVDSSFFGTEVYPTFDIGFNQRLTEAFSWALFVRYINEDTGTYGGSGNYASNESLRAGANATYRYTPKWSFTFGANEVFSDYSSATTKKLADRTENTANFSIGTNYQWTNQMATYATVNYTFGSDEYDNNSGRDYNRFNISTGVRYSF